MSIIPSNNALNFIEAFLRDGTEQSMSDLILYCKKYDLDDFEILNLAQGLADSGVTITHTNEQIYDIPSTGGPSSLSTLLCPVILKLLGNKVLKLGVPGRPAGGIDVLSKIRGYNINPDPTEVKEWSSKSNYIHFLANHNFTPADSKLFLYRKNNNALDIPCLVIASLLSKKIAVRLSKVGLDVRVGEFGNFGKTFEEARDNCQRFIRVAALAGIDAKCFITNGMIAQQPYIGRGEALLALYNIFKGEACSRLSEHLGVCLEMSLSISDNKSINFDISDIEDAFIENIELQNGNKESFYSQAVSVSEKHIHYINASRSGFLIIDLYKIRDAIVSVQNSIEEEFADPCGVILKSKSAQFILAGEKICTYRYELTNKNEFEAKLRSAFIITENINSINNIEIINNGEI